MNIGIYQIRNLQDNKVYIGSSKNIKKRWKGHLKTLKKGIHINIILQRAFDKYGENNFVFEFLEECNIDKLFILEQKYLDKTIDKYNIGPANGGDRISKNPNKNDIINKMKESLKIRYKNMTYEERKNIYGSNGNKNGNWKGGDEILKKKCKCGKFIKIKNISCKNCRNREGENNPFYGKKHTQETLNKIKETQSKNIRWITITKPEDLSYTKKYKITYEDKSEKIVFGCKIIGKEFNVSQAYVSNLVNKKHIPQKGKMKGIKVEFIF